MATIPIVEGIQYEESATVTSAVTAFSNEYLFNTGYDHKVAIEVSVDGDGMNDFQVQLKHHPDGEWFTFLSGTDWDTASTSMLFCEATGPHEMADSGVANATISVRGAHSMRYRAQTDTTSATVTVRHTISSGGSGR